MDVEIHPPLGTEDFLQKGSPTSFNARNFDELSRDISSEGDGVASDKQTEGDDINHSDAPLQNSPDVTQNNNVIAKQKALSERTSSPSLNRKNKPSSIDLSDHTPLASDDNLDELSSAANASADEYKLKQEEVISDDDTSAESPSTPMVTLSKHIVKIMDAGINSPLVRRSSRIEQILNLPDVKAALVRDEGFEMRSILRKNCPEKPLCDRLQTPCAKKALEEHFKFEGESPVESESVSGSDASSLLSSRDTLAENEADNTDDSSVDRRPRLGIIQDRKSVLNPLERIADSLGPSNLFNDSVRKKQTSSPVLDKKEKPQKRMKSSLQEHELPKSSPPTGKSPALLSRFRFSSLRETPSRLEGWDSLTRALARVGVNHPAWNHMSMDSINLNPKVSPILKRAPPVSSPTQDDSAVVQVQICVDRYLLSLTFKAMK